MVQKKNRAQRISQAKITAALESINIAPLETCNLHCKYCYTHKNKDVLSNKEILNFVDKYQKHVKLKSILLCGGEVFTLPNFPALVNQLIKKNIFVTIITNGTIDRLKEIEDPQNCQILVSLDGPKEIHDANRGQSNFEKTIKYIKHAQKLGFPIEIMFLVTKESYPHKDSFDVLGLPKTYLTDRKLSLTSKQVLDIKQHYPTYPAKNFGCFQLCLQSNGDITGCCESKVSLGKIADDPKIYISNFQKSLLPCFKCKKCGGCSDQNYLCGYKSELNLSSCEDVVKSFT